jgi:nucleoside-diphosphate-sugar epimerase/glycosyltransferase involved in cell wall biosynthesis
MRLLITGGSGFIGTNLVEDCLEKGIPFINVDWNSPLNPVHKPYWKYVDIMDKPALAEIFTFFQPTAIIHLAARTDTNIYDLNGDLTEYIQNTEGTKNVLECIKNTPSIKRAIITSTMFVCEAGHIPGSDLDYRPFTLYGVSKKLTESYTWEANLDCTWTIIRPQTIWGPWALRYREMFNIMSKGLYFHPDKTDVLRSFGYVKNVVWQLHQLLKAPAEKVHRQVFYVGDKPVNLLKWVQTVSLAYTGNQVKIMPAAVIRGLGLIGDLLKIINIPFPMTSTRYNSMTQNYLTPIEKTYTALGKPIYTIEGGIKEFAYWFQNLDRDIKPHTIRKPLMLKQNSKPLSNVTGNKTKILVVGVTPPPYGGQHMMTERLIKANFENLKIYHVKMAFSQSMAVVGRFKLYKVIHMFTIVVQALYSRFKNDVHTLYYMPGGSNAAPVLRDIFILFFLRLFFKKTIFHFRAAGVSEIVANQPYLLKKMAQFVYHAPDLAIHLSSLNPNDGGYFKAKKVVVIPNGLEDTALPYLPIHRKNKEYVTILYVGIVQETKGIVVLLKAAKILHDKGYKIRVDIVGEYGTPTFKEQATSFCKKNNLEEVVFFRGEKKDHEKWQYFIAADIFCFPSFFESESFGNVLVEAMMFELPVVGTRWRGIPDLIDENKTGFTVAIQDPDDTANKLEQFIVDANLRQEYGRNARHKFLSAYQVDSFFHNLQQHFVNIHK